MKKITGWPIIIACSVFLMIFVVTFIVLIPGIPKMPEVMTVKEIISTVIGFAIVIILLIVGLMNGIKKIKKDKILKVIDYTDSLDINLTGRISYTDYQKLMLGLSFKKPTYLVFVCVIIIFSLSFINNESGSSQIYLKILPFLILGFLLSPILILVQVKKIYRTNRIFQEQLNYKLTNDSIHIKGETVDSIQKWTGFYKIKETSSFFMFYQGEGTATLLDKKMFTNNDLAEFKQFIQSLNIKKG